MEVAYVIFACGALAIGSSNHSCNWEIGFFCVLGREIKWFPANVTLPLQDTVIALTIKHKQRGRKPSLFQLDSHMVWTRFYAINCPRSDWFWLVSPTKHIENLHPEECSVGCLAEKTGKKIPDRKRTLEEHEMFAYRGTAGRRPGG